ncbi:transcription factor [Ancistrocladus abbreviatus]
MEDTGNDLYVLSNRLRTRSSIWESDANGAFSRSSREEDDEEALKWAALEKLPTYSRLRKGILTGPSGRVNEVDIKHLGIEEQRKLVDKLVHVPEEDNEKFLLRLKSRLDTVGIEMPTVEVRFEHLKIEAEAYVGSRALPTIINFAANLVEGFVNSLHILPSRKKHLTILNDISGVIKPKRMTLLLGPPSSGKTTLLLALAGKLGKDLEVSGRVTYNGYDMDEFVPRRTAAYISQYDTHIGELTVRETFQYSARFQGVGFRYEMLAELARREKEANIKPDPDIDLFMKARVTEGQEEIITDYVLKVLDLEICADTIVGDQMMRGISGGQRKRVTTGEMLVGPAKVLFMDEISTGLDSSTTFQIVNMLRQNVHILNGTALISLLQPAPETYNLFDDIILLSDGLIVYQGPRENVLEFFEHVGFRCPERKGVADFLQEVTSRKDQQQYWTRSNEPYRFITAKEFAEVFQSFHVGREVAEELATPFEKAKSHPAALTTEQYGVRKWDIFKACFSREWLLMRRGSFIWIFKITQLAMMAFITMTVFLRTKMNKDTVTPGGTIYMGALFFSAIMLMFVGIVEMSMTVAKLPVFYKQRDLLFYPAWAYALPTWILKMPLTLVEICVWVFPTYYVIGYDPNVGRLFKQVLLLAILNQAASGIFRFIGAAARTMIIANTFGSFALVMLFSLGGFVLSRKQVKKWWIWGYWSSPLMYAQNGIAVNEFLGKSWGKIIPGTNETLGMTVLKSKGFFPHAYWYWLGVGALLGFTFVFNILYILALTFLKAPKKHQAIVPEVSENGDEKTERGSVGLSNRVSSFDERTISEEQRGEIRHSNTSRSSVDVTVDATQTKKEKGMVLPFEPHSITFDEVRYSVDMPNEMKMEGVTEDRLELLKGISGTFRPGVLTALMGVSGAGKTTLMDVLAGRKTGGYIEGNIMISGFPKNQGTFARISGYCEQNDIHSPNVTIYESLLYSAWLRLSPDINTETRKMFVEEVMELIELTSLRGALVGLPGVSGLSTEQRKRLTIAVELVANPSIIFMDEPTSGLDARAAAIVMRTVRNTVDTGRTVVCTIHQPSIDIFEAFDELLLLKRGGKEIYVGPLGQHSSLLIKYFEGIQGVPKIKDGYNPATWMLEVTTMGQELALGVDFAEIYRNSDLYGRNKALIQELSIPHPGSKELHFSTQYAQPFFMQLLVCLWKQHWSYWRNPPYTAMRLIFTVLVALMFGTMFWRLGHRHEKEQDLFNAMGSMYAAVLFLGVQNLISVQPVVTIERTVLYRERAAGMYSALPYAFAQVLIEVPYVFVQAALYCVLVYSMMGYQWTAAKFFWYLFFAYFTLLNYTYFGMMTVAATPNQQIAAVIGSTFNTLWNLFSGFIIPRPRIPVWWRWFYWICPFAWTLYGLVGSQFGDINDMLVDQNVTVQQFVRSYLGFRHGFLGAVAGVIVGYSVVFAFIFAFCIKVFNFQKR